LASSLELALPVANCAREGATRKAADLSAWLHAVLQLYAARIIDCDVATARIAGRLLDVALAKGLVPGFATILIAATARYRELTILTRNPRHFAPLGVPVLDPFISLPE